MWIYLCIVLRLYCLDSFCLYHIVSGWAAVSQKCLEIRHGRSSAIGLRYRSSWYSHSRGHFSQAAALVKLRQLWRSSEKTHQLQKK